MIYQSYLSTPIGFLRILSNGKFLYDVQFQDTDGPEDPDPITEWARTQLNEYFEGKRHSFNLPLEPIGTLFEQKVWKTLQTISYGTTSSYSDIAQIVEAPHAMQAIGNANAKNPIAIIIPCHRVIAKDGKLSGYAGGIERKKWLLHHEKALSL